jgi:hypothetical protein
MGYRVIYRARKGNLQYVATPYFSPDIPNRVEIGPFTFAESNELVGRIKEISIDGSVSFSSGETTRTFGLSSKFIDRNFGINSIDDDKYQEYGKDFYYFPFYIGKIFAIYPYVVENTSSDGFNIYDDYISGELKFKLYEKNSQFYFGLTGIIVISRRSRRTGNIISTVWVNVDSNPRPSATVYMNLTLAGKQFQIPCDIDRSDIPQAYSGGSFDAKPVTWWEYANANGDPIWDSTTGSRTSNPFS